jgi:hypothetical protein
MGQYFHPCILTQNKRQVKTWLSPHAFGNGAKLMEHSWLTNNFVRAFESLIVDNPEIVVWCGDYADEVKGCKTNLYDRCTDEGEAIPTPTEKEIRYVINHDKKEFVDKNNLIKDSEGYCIHPLPLLTCNSNGRGGGDFRGESPLVGKWAYDLISVSSKKPKDFKEIIFDLKE